MLYRRKDAINLVKRYMGAAHNTTKSKMVRNLIKK